MAPSKPPLWRQAFDAVEGVIAPPAERAVQTDLFADTVALALKGRRRVQREIERQSRRALHLVNIPTATDVKRVSEQLAALQRQTRALEHHLAEQQSPPTAQRRAASGSQTKERSR
jgi:hypothetical protein